ncbi:MAG: hypothetical protein C3F07_02545 [Anaerolineales bacterium]|nr:MAG: hypothetical protein C3F07_02545 [Anaerolineales bacterium]
MAIGGLLVLGGLLALLDTMGIISNAGGIFWGMIWAAIGLFFLYLLLNGRGNWWAAFPAFTLLGMAAASFLPNALDGLGGLAFLGGISLAFWWVYLTDTRGRWWAIIPAGVLLTLGAVSAVDEFTRFDSGGLFLLGLGLTFVLVAVLPTGGSRTWALIPGAVLLVLGALTSSPLQGLSQYVWPVVLILLGIYFVWRFFRVQPNE